MKKKITIDGMNCGHCSSRIEKGLSDLEGMQDVNVSLENKTADVAFDESKLAINDIMQKIEDLGYNPMM